MLLTEENYRRGFLVDDQLMGGISTPGGQAPEGVFAAYVLNHLTGEYLGYAVFSKLAEALGALNQVQRPWKFESVGGCQAGEAGNCAGESCPKAGRCGKMLAALAPGAQKGPEAACGC